jgi:hypothetical protein
MIKTCKIPWGTPYSWATTWGASRNFPCLYHDIIRKCVSKSWTFSTQVSLSPEQSSLVKLLKNAHSTNKLKSTWNFPRFSTMQAKFASDPTLTVWFRISRCLKFGMCWVESEIVESKSSQDTINTKQFSHLKHCLCWNSQRPTEMSAFLCVGFEFFFLPTSATLLLLQYISRRACLLWQEIGT